MVAHKRKIQQLRSAAWRIQIQNAKCYLQILHERPEGCDSASVHNAVFIHFLLNLFLSFLFSMSLFWLCMTLKSSNNHSSSRRHYRQGLYEFLFSGQLH